MKAPKVGPAVLASTASAGPRAHEDQAIETAPTAYTRIKLTIAFDGTNYAGWQAQKTGIAVQEVIEKALKSIFNLDFRLHGSSRTDAGVHARGMVAHVDIPRAKFVMTPRKLSLALNANLPEDIRVMRATLPPATFHARFQASGKQYRYFVYNFHAMDPLLRTQAWHVPQPLDLARMKTAARAFIGKHDFESFAANRGYKMESTIRTVTRCDIRQSGPLITVIIEGDGFLYKMCRGIVGTLVQIGMGKFDPHIVSDMLESKDRRAAGMSAPAHGLILWQVFYRSESDEE